VKDSELLTFHSAIPRVRLDRDPFGVLEGLDFKKTRKSKRLNFKPTMPSIAERLEDFVEAEHTLTSRLSSNGITISQLSLAAFDCRISTKDC